MKASDYIVDFLAQRGVHTVFGYIGGMITHLVDSIDRHPNVQYVQTYHEQTAAMAAEGFALGTGRFGVAISTSGPGVTNMLTGIADAWFGNVPTVFITGQVNTYEYKYDKPVRQQGFQEMDVVSLVSSITKYAVLVDDAERLPYELEKAVFLATTGRKGPVVIDLPMNIQRADIHPAQLAHYTPAPAAAKMPDVSHVSALLAHAQRPMVLLGGGCQDEESRQAVEDWLRETQLPFVTSLMGHGAVDERSPRYMGLIGSYGNRCANMGVARCDLLLALGTRLDTRQTGARLDAFLPEAPIVHVDLDADELVHHRLPHRTPVQARVADFVKELRRTGTQINMGENWLPWLAEVKAHYDQAHEVARFVKADAPYRFLEQIQQHLPEEALVTADVGQNQMWVAQSLCFGPRQRFFTSGGLAPMGFSLPVAIGLAFARPELPIFCFTGDGGLYMSLQSLPLIAQYGLNIRLLVFNNRTLGMITQFQDLYFEGRRTGTTRLSGYQVQDLEAIAKAHGLHYAFVDKEHAAELHQSLRAGTLIELRTEETTVVSPKLEYDKPFAQPSPALPEEEFEKVMSKLL